MQATIEPAFFTVYVTEYGIELLPGCADYPNCQALHTSKSYESAYQFAQAAAAHRNLPFRLPAV